MATRRQKRHDFELGPKIAAAIIGLLVTLIGTGITSMITLYTHVAILAEAETRTEQSLNQSVATMATKDELRSLQEQLSEQSATLREIEAAISGRWAANSRGK